MLCLILNKKRFKQIVNCFSLKIISPLKRENMQYVIKYEIIFSPFILNHYHYYSIPYKNMSRVSQHKGVFTMFKK